MTVEDLELFIGGRWHRSAGRERIAVTNPARPTEVVGTVPAGTPADVDAAVQSARLAQPEWAALSVKERAAHLADAAARLAAIDPTAPMTLTREMGKILPEATLDFQSPPWVWSHYMNDIDAVQRLLSDEYDDDAGRLVIRRRPVGVVGAIVPWNWPIALLGVKLGPALLAGNTVVAVPSPFAPLGVLKAIEAIADALPPGAVNVVTGHGHVVGAALAAHQEVDLVAFTGGLEAGRSVAHALAERVRRGVFELGGNDAALVLEDATVDDALVEGLASAFAMTSGQVCFAVKRLFVHTELIDELTERLAARLDQHVIGDGLESGVTMGPLANAPQHQRFTALLADTEAQGARLRPVGLLADPQNRAGGYFHRPTLVTDVDPSARVVTEEQFGPALPIIPFRTDDEALALANGTRFGLTASIWSGDVARAEKLSGLIDAGVTFVNAHGMAAFDTRAPFGGVKDSGYGREMGNDGLLEFTTAQQFRIPK